MKTKTLILVTISLMLQACTVARYDLKNKFSVPAPLFKEGEKTEYYISLSAKPEQLTRDANYSADQIKKIRLKYSESTQKVFDQEGIPAAETPNRDSAAFLICIKSTPYFSALPQEWLTGLSFGLIPSWGTRHNEYSYTFEKIGAKSEHTYTVDNKSFNHLVCFPVFWTMFFTLDESRVYEKALRNYLIKN
jgi:hypothetical protein